MSRHLRFWSAALVGTGLLLVTGQWPAQASVPQIVIRYSITGGYRQAGTLARARVGSDYGCQVYRGNRSYPAYLDVSYDRHEVLFAQYPHDAIDIYAGKGFKAGMTHVSGSGVYFVIVISHHIFSSVQDDKQNRATVTLSPNGLSGTFRAVHLHASHGTDLLHTVRDHYYVNVQGSWHCSKASVLMH